MWPCQLVSVFESRFEFKLINNGVLFLLEGEITTDLFASIRVCILPIGERRTTNDIQRMVLHCFESIAGHIFEGDTVMEPNRLVPNNQLSETNSKSGHIVGSVLT